ncbi:MAG: transporter substrate-binding domain-containing protein [bacterium]|nr:transporter substrate-binding domain-containing protein [bacterium]
MRKRSKLVGIILAAVLVAGSLAGCSGKAAADGGAQTISVGTMGTYSPYSYEDENGKLTGYDLEVLRKIEEIDPGLHFEFQAAAWESLFPGLDADTYQMLANQICSNPEREEKYYLTTNPYFTCVSSIIVKKGTTGINDLNDLQGKKIGLTVGDSFTRVVEEWNEANGNILDIQYYSEDITTILQDIDNGRIDATVNDPSMAASKAKLQGLEVEPVGERLDASPTYFIFKKDDAGKELRDRIDKDLETLIKNGELSKLSEEWFGADYTK